MEWMLTESTFLDCDDFSYSEGNGLYSFWDHAEGSRVCLSQQEFIQQIAFVLVERNEEEEEVDDYHLALAANVLGNATEDGKAKFLFGLMG